MTEKIQRYCDNCHEWKVIHESGLCKKCAKEIADLRAKNPMSKLQQWYCNARKTGAGCLGHMKAERNEMKCRNYAEELRANGEEVPHDQLAFKLGYFNGEGAG